MINISGVNQKDADCYLAAFNRCMDQIEKRGLTHDEAINNVLMMFQPLVNDIETLKQYLFEQVSMEVVEDEKVKHFKSSDFTPLFLSSLERDLAVLKQLKEHWETIKEDPKLDQFKKQLTQNIVLKDSKILIFTESKETAYYLFDNLKSLIGDKLAVFSGESSQHQKMEIEYSFNPKYESEGKGKYDVLITTDVLAEGINLHQSNVLINYDLPWNPTRIMQRGGLKSLILLAGMIASLNMILENGLQNTIRWAKA